MEDAQAMTIPEQAVKAALEAFLNTARTIDGIKAALTAAAPYMRYKREFNISSCTVDLSGADYKCFLDGVTGFEVSLDEETRSFGEYNEGDRVFFDAETGDLDAHDLFILSRPAFEKKVQERISALPHMSASAREQALEEAETQGNLKQWNIQDHLKTPGGIAEYLQAILDEGDNELLINAVSDAIRTLSSPDHAGAGKVEWNTRPAPAATDTGLVTVGWLWEYAQHRTDDRGYYGYETVITESNPTDHVSPAEKLRNVRELVTRQNAEEVIAAKDARIRELEAEREAVLRHIPMEYLQAHDVAGATGPTKAMKIAEAIRDYSEARWHLFDRIKVVEADNKRLREALEPFAEYGEDYFDKDHNGDPLPDEQGVGWIYMNFGHFRKARTALGEVKP